MVGIIGDRAGQLGKMENTKLEGRGVVWSKIQSSKEVAPACVG
jgi:hypothetical protein